MKLPIELIYGYGPDEMIAIVDGHTAKIASFEFETTKGVEPAAPMSWFFIKQHFCYPHESCAQCRWLRIESMLGRQAPPSS